jgi:hypothetical protein
MIDLEIIERAAIPSDWLTGAKAYAAIADNAGDAWLLTCVTRAVLSVQEKADKSLIACTIRVTDEDAQAGVRLYMSVKDIISVTDNKGAMLPYSVEGRMVYPLGGTASVTYTTEPSQGNIDLLLPVVYQYATALYDGQDSRTLASILEQCR